MRSSPSAPVLIGTENGVTVRCRALVACFGVNVYDVHYFTGDGVQARIDVGSLVVV